MWRGWRLPGAGLWLLLLLPFLGCTGTAQDVTARLTAANLLAGSSVQALASAVDARAIEPGSKAAAAIALTLDAVEMALDSAGAALRAGLPEMAARNLGAAEAQLAGLQPLLPGTSGGQ